MERTRLFDTPALRTVLLVGVAAALVGCGKGGPPGAAPAHEEASLLTVEVVQAQAQLWPQTVQANGAIEAWQEIIVSPETGGLRIAELRVDVGAVVKRGDLLARLADDTVRAELRKQEATVAQARASYEEARSNYRRARATENSGALSDQQIEAYRIAEQTAKATLDAAAADRDSARLKLAQTRITAVDDGVVVSKSGVLGNVAAAGAELYRVIRRGRLEWRPEVDARQLAAIGVGDTAQLTLPDGRRVEGKVRLTGPTLNDGTGRATVYVTLDEASGARRGMFASGILRSGDSAALTLPQSAITRRDGRAYVWLLQEGEHVAGRAVQTGRQLGERIEILSGVTPQERVVLSGGAFLSEGARVTIARAGAANDPSAKAARNGSDAGTSGPAPDRAAGTAGNGR
ncbi:hypothetical protein CJ010_11545 [Azoarcus sp. DD4]|uniref:efflux RND transporter periplasmic adaptor subunit n=1 Tax=Azoarcus sp. DD4 TaxID=2027405 RepID=UPI00112BA170|nr:efflux RND transporter periplasmic adaptor subunit [Azoarcus sp. DD4]QDF97115.1 hypothetical protein CJ010_11545 [Azoarcus sp. DD4]